ncbi:DUF4130 domain-containing protein [Candidatus Woesearchaeota archaeon]|nr:DUF4130 domain-containing protein [Candidatus Woesearchaeota archaeon]MBW3022316.1 DUF4130 domain-containing protein [Candidatus Woesearchaeota archaeon]
MIEEFFGLAPRHEKFTQKLLDTVKSQPLDLVENKATAESKHLYSLHRQVAGDFQRCRAFARLEISKHGIIYGKVQPEHRVEDLVAEWFVSRFPLFIIVLQSRRGTFIMSKDSELKIVKEDIKTIVNDLEQTLPENPLLSSLIEFDEQSWENLYDSNFIKQRKNTKLFLKNIPKKYHQIESLALERRKFMKCLSLKEFF